MLEVDHEFCVSIYIRDPNGNMVEFCHSVRDFTPAERSRAHDLLLDEHPPLEKDFSAQVWEPVATMSTP